MFPHYGYALKSLEVSSCAAPRRKALEMIVSVHISILFSMENIYYSLLGHYCFLHSQVHKAVIYKCFYILSNASLSPNFHMVDYLKQT